MSKIGISAEFYRKFQDKHKWSGKKLWENIARIKHILENDCDELKHVDTYENDKNTLISWCNRLKSTYEKIVVETTNSNGILPSVTVVLNDLDVISNEICHATKQKCFIVNFRPGLSIKIMQDKCTINYQQAGIFEFQFTEKLLWFLPASTDISSFSPKQQSLKVGSLRSYIVNILQLDIRFLDFS